MDIPDFQRTDLAADRNRSDRIRNGDDLYGVVVKVSSIDHVRII